tara:strand:+ start:129 stop:299 length:171 start_codon:yes stop_codon:yes gene_type:complete
MTGYLEKQGIRPYGSQMYQELLDDPRVEKHIFLDMMGNIVWRFEHPEFILEVCQEA